MEPINLKDITLVSVCGDARFLINIIKAAKHCMKHVNFGRVKILSNVKTTIEDIEVIKIPPLNQEKYSEFCIYELDKYIDTNFCLTFQGDGFIINPNLWQDKFLEFDYIGAPWLSEVKNRVGNGGFSLRSQKFLRLAKTLEYNKNIQFQRHVPAGQLITPEDWFVCCYCYDTMLTMGTKFADVNLAYQFSVEHQSIEKQYDRYDIQTYNSFGFHGSFNVAAMNLLKHLT
jgi:hypothetical protein